MAWWSIRKRTASEFLKDARKKAVWALLGLAGFYVLSFAQDLYGLDHLPTWPELGSLILSSAKGYPSFLREWLIDRPFDFFILQRPAHGVAVLVLVAGYAILFVLIRRANKALNAQSDLIKGADLNHALISQSGIKGRFPHATSAEGGAPWDILRADILNPENKFLYVLGANGVDTFGAPTSPLYETMHQFRGTMRVILCKPDSKSAAGRASAVGVRPQDYSKSIRLSAST